MARGAKDCASIIASCADYDSTAEEEVPESRKQANITAKRSSQQMTPAHQAAATSEVNSDSGYSSRTQATAASADSIASVRAKAAAKVSTTEVEDNVAAAPGP